MFATLKFLIKGQSHLSIRRVWAFFMPACEPLIWRRSTPCIRCNGVCKSLDKTLATGLVGRRSFFSA